MSEPIQYKITTLDDILKIPSDRIEVMLSDLIPHIKKMSATKELISSLLPEGENIDEAFQLGALTWIDDGKTDVTTNITVKMKEEGK